MARGRLVRFSRTLCWCAGLATSDMSGITAGVAGQREPASRETAAIERLRPMDMRAATALHLGLERSASFAALAAAVEASDLIVYVQTANIEAPSVLTFMTATALARFVHISLNRKELEPHMIAWLGHELQHAREIAVDQSVRDAASLAALYQRIGERSSTGGICTKSAQFVGATVLAEVRSAPGPRHLARKGGLR